MNLLWLILAIWGVMAVLFAGLWAIQRKTGNAGIVDLAWTLGTGAAGLILVSQGAAPLVRRVIVGTIVAVWSLRLSYHLARRIFSEPEDGRYADMREQWGDRFQSRMFLFFQIQASWTVLFAIPMLSAAMNPTAGLQWFDIVGLLFFAASIVGESVADQQLSRFKRNPDSRGKVCRVGLWKYSRHPNYFFEWLHWFAYLFISWGTVWMIGSVAGVMVMYLFLTRITGIPITEKRISRTRKAEYEIYQQEVSPFFPLPNRAES